MTARIGLHGYLPIADYGAIGNLRTVALVGRDGSIDWCCLPELDRPSVFGALLDDRKGGRFRVAPVGGGRGEQRYLDDTNVLRTVFDAPGGRLSVTDFMPLRGSILGAGDPSTAPEIHRVLACEAGEVEVEVEWSPRFNYARIRTGIVATEDGFRASGGDARMGIGGLPPGARIETDEGGATLRARFLLRGGERRAIVTRFGAEDPRCDPEGSFAALAETGDAWYAWVHQEAVGDRAWAGEWEARVIRSELVLKLLTHPDTGAIAAAATTSLPEEIGGVRNWDYRFSWIRDAAFTVQALSAVGHHAEAVDFLDWAERVSKAKGERDWTLQIMYGLHGETEFPERELPHLEGYRGSRPVRIGNGAGKQRQHDIYGELLNAAYEMVRRGTTLAPDLWPFLADVADAACSVWREPDAGIWEVRGGPRHFVYSKVMIWTALDRAVRLAEYHGLRGDVDRWRRSREIVREEVLRQGYDAELGAFVQSYGSRVLDASNLLIPLVEFLPFDDPRVQGTIDRTLERLTRDGLVYRYLADDGLPGGEGAFGLCTFWLVNALALSGRAEEARGIFEGMLARANHLGLYAEQIDPRTGAFLGNFPQAFTHLGFINSALYLAHAEGRRMPDRAPVGSAEHSAEGGHVSSPTAAHGALQAQNEGGRP